jgi:hypothetical protein
MQYTVNQKILSYEVSGTSKRGDDIVLLDRAIDLSASTPWAGSGFTVQELFPENIQQDFQKQTVRLLIDCWRRAGLNVSNDFLPDQYHTLANDREKHLAAVDHTKLLSTDLFPLGVSLMEKRISEICHVPVIARNPFDNQSVFHFRVIRPNHADNNPLHRDVWLEDYDDCMNIYIPVAGSNENSSLILIPGSHLWAESRIDKTEAGAIVNQIKFNVPAITSIDGDFTVIRPDPKPNEILVFSPYLIHGGAVNLNADQTRISIEMRFWKK